MTLKSRNVLKKTSIDRSIMLNTNKKLREQLEVSQASERSRKTTWLNWASPKQRLKKIKSTVRTKLSQRWWKRRQHSCSRQSWRNRCSSDGMRLKLNKAKTLSNSKYSRNWTRSTGKVKRWSKRARSNAESPMTKTWGTRCRPSKTVSMRATCTSIESISPILRTCKRNLRTKSCRRNRLWLWGLLVRSN